MLPLFCLLHAVTLAASLSFSPSSFPVNWPGLVPAANVFCPPEVYVAAAWALGGCVGMVDLQDTGSVRISEVAVDAPSWMDSCCLTGMG